MNKKIKKQRVAIFDIDGVLANFEEKFCEAFGNKNRHLYDLFARYPELDESLLIEWLGDEENYGDLNPIFGGISLLNDLKSKGYYILLITSRPKSLQKVTTDWLKKYYLDYDELFFGKDKVEVTKSFQHLNDNKKVSIFIDDHLPTLRAMRESFKFPCVCWSQPWNTWDNYYPQAIHNQETFKIEINMGDGNYKWIWSK